MLHGKDKGKIPAEEIERTLALIFRQELEKALPTLRLSSEHRTIAKDKINSLTKGTFRPLYLNAIEKITLFTDKLEIRFYTDGLRAILWEFSFGTEASIRKEETTLISYPISLTRGQKGSCLIHGEIIPTGSIPELTEAVRKSFLYHKLLLDGTYSTVKALTQSLGFSDTEQTRRILKLRILAADILTRILKNQIPTIGLSPSSCKPVNALTGTGKESFSHRKRPVRNGRGVCLPTLISDGSSDIPKGGCVLRACGRHR